MKKKLTAVVMAVALSGCAGLKQTISEHAQLRAVHKAEKKIATGNEIISTGAALVASGKARVSEGQSELKVAHEALSNSIGVNPEGEK